MRVFMSNFFVSLRMMRGLFVFVFVSGDFGLAGASLVILKADGVRADGDCAAGELVLFRV